MIRTMYHATRADGVRLMRTFSNQRFLIERDGVRYIEAIEPEDAVQTYTETNVLARLYGDLDPSMVLEGASFTAPDGTASTGTMPNKGAVAETIDGLQATTYSIPEGYHNGSGTVSLTDDIEAALAAI